MNSRPSFDQIWIEVAAVIAKRSTCPRRQVGAVLTDRHGVIVATGYNGNARGEEHCVVAPCEGATLPSGTGLDRCRAVHAEQNALMACSDVWKIHTCYTTTSPCLHCIKMLLNTSCQRIVFLEEYPHSDSKTLWTSAGREWISYHE